MGNHYHLVVRPPRRTSPGHETAERGAALQAAVIDARSCRARLPGALQGDPGRSRRLPRGACALCGAQPRAGGLCGDAREYSWSMPSRTLMGLVDPPSGWRRTGCWGSSARSGWTADASIRLPSARASACRRSGNASMRRSSGRGHLPTMAHKVPDDGRLIRSACNCSAGRRACPRRMWSAVRRAMRAIAEAAASGAFTLAQLRPVLRPPLQFDQPDRRQGPQGAPASGAGNASEQMSKWRDLTPRSPTTTRAPAGEPVRPIVVHAISLPPTSSVVLGRATVPPTPGSGKPTLLRDHPAPACFRSFIHPAATARRSALCDCRIDAACRRVVLERARALQRFFHRHRALRAATRCPTRAVAERLAVLIVGWSDAIRSRRWSGTRTSRPDARPIRAFFDWKRLDVMCEQRRKLAIEKLLGIQVFLAVAMAVRF